ncbi:hypothetical protein I4U23_022856 [Adineta vaga]|nr:hypothetical protein I4U23_022856 [Adineta vaga]
MAHRLSAVFVTIWILHGILPSIYFDHIISPTTGSITCASKSTTYHLYYTYGYVLILVGILPASITVLFGSLAYFNVRQLAHRTLPLVRRQLDKQLTTMVLLQVISNFFAIVPPLITMILLLQSNLIKDPVIIAQVQLANYVNYTFYYFYFASPFYIYICVSQRFRQQFIHVIFGVHLKRWRRPKVMANQVLPET